MPTPLGCSCEPSRAPGAGSSVCSGWEREMRSCPGLHSPSHSSLTDAHGLVPEAILPAVCSPLLPPHPPGAARHWEQAAAASEVLNQGCWGTIDPKMLCVCHGRVYSEAEPGVQHPREQPHRQGCTRPCHGTLGLQQVFHSARAGLEQQDEGAARCRSEDCQHLGSSHW